VEVGRALGFHSHAMATPLMRQGVERGKTGRTKDSVVVDKGSCQGKASQGALIARWLGSRLGAPASTPFDRTARATWRSSGGTGR
jgi:hypothetical protein